MDQGFFKHPNTIHPLNNSVALENPRTPELTCKTVGHIQDLLLPGAQQHSNHSLLISHFPYSKRKNDCHKGGGGRRDARPVSRRHSGGEERRIMIVLSRPVFTAAKGRPGAPGTKACPRGRARVTPGGRDPNTGCQQRAATDPSATHRGPGRLRGLRALFLPLKPLGTSGKERN